MRLSYGYQHHVQFTCMRGGVSPLGYFPVAGSEFGGGVVAFSEGVWRGYPEILKLGQISSFLPNPGHFDVINMMPLARVLGPFQGLLCTRNTEIVPKVVK